MANSTLSVFMMKKLLLIALFAPGLSRADDPVRQALDNHIYHMVKTIIPERMNEIQKSIEHTPQLTSAHCLYIGHLKQALHDLQHLNAVFGHLQPTYIFSPAKTITLVKMKWQTWIMMSYCDPAYLPRPGQPDPNDPYMIRPGDAQGILRSVAEIQKLLAQLNAPQMRRP